MSGEDLAVLWVLDDLERASTSQEPTGPSPSSEDDLPPAWRGHVVTR